MGWHSHTLYDELLRVPLLVKYPGRRHAGAAVAGQVRSIDIAPTILAAASIAIPDSFLGVDLAPLAGSGAQTTDLVAVSRLDREMQRDFTSVRTEDWKLMPPPRSLRTQRSALWLFDLDADPQEQWDAAGSHLAQKSALEEALAAAIAARPRREGERVAPRGSTLQDLRDLGYIVD